MLTKSKIKFIQSLSHKKFRDEAGVFVAEGPKLFNELIDQPNLILQEIYATGEWIESGITDASINEKLTRIDSSYLDRISSLNTPNQLVAIFKKPGFEKQHSYKGKLTIMLDNVQDPGNLGTIIRCADWFGIEQVICSKDSVDAFNSKVVQSTMGSIGRVEVKYQDLLQVIDENKIPVFAATLDGTDLYGMNKPVEGFIVIGNESKGISESVLQAATEKITIPKKGKAESLNASIAAAIILAEFCH